VISVEDQGEGFDPENLPDPTDEDRLELPSGRGVLLIRAYMSEVEYNDRGNRLTMTYRRPS
jgi:serine/threonine-protein kinase RsbW